MCLKKCNNSTTDYLSSIIDRHNELKSLVKEIEEIEEWRRDNAAIWDKKTLGIGEHKYKMLNQCQSRIFEIIKSL